MRPTIRHGGAATARRSRRLQPAMQCGLERWTAGARSVPLGLAIFLRLIVMPLDRIIHAYAEHYDLGREKDERKPIYPRTIRHFERFHSAVWNWLSSRIALARNAPSTAPLQDRQAWSF